MLKASWYEITYYRPTSFRRQWTKNHVTSFLKSLRSVLSSCYLKKDSLECTTSTLRNPKFRIRVLFRFWLSIWNSGSSNAVVRSNFLNSKLIFQAVQHLCNCRTMLYSVKPGILRQAYSCTLSITSLHHGSLRYWSLVMLLLKVWEPQTVVLWGILVYEYTYTRMYEPIV